MPMLILKGIYKKLGQFQLQDISLNISEGTYYVLLGRSGAGKTQLLELIAGLTRPDKGEIWLDGEEITTKKIQGRGIGLVFQDYAVFPNMTVYGNIAYPLNRKHDRHLNIEERVHNIARELNITHLLDRGTRHLSGGELQRVALARTLITSPRLLLLDEPMASIDASLKDDIKRLLRRLNRRGLTIIHVTHDYREAISLSTMVGVIHNGRIIQEGTPDSVFRKPVNRFVARYAGIRNFFRVTFAYNNGSCYAQAGNNLKLMVPHASYPHEGLLLLRSEDIIISSTMPGDLSCNTVKGIITDILPSEFGVEITVDAGETFYVDVTSDSYRKDKLKEGMEAWVSFRPEACIVIDGNG